MSTEAYTVSQGASFGLSVKSIYDEFAIKATTLTGWNFVFTLKKSRDDADAAALVTITTAQMTIDNAEPSVGVVVTPAQLAALDVGATGFICFKGKSPGGFIDTLKEGTLTKTASARQTF